MGTTDYTDFHRVFARAIAQIVHLANVFCGSFFIKNAGRRKLFTHHLRSALGAFPFIAWLASYVFDFVPAFGADTIAIRPSRLRTTPASPAAPASAACLSHEIHLLSQSTSYQVIQSFFCYFFSSSSSRSLICWRTSCKSRVCALSTSTSCSRDGCS